MYSPCAICNITYPRIRIIFIIRNRWAKRIFDIKQCLQIVTIIRQPAISIHIPANLIFQTLDTIKM